MLGPGFFVAPAMRAALANRDVGKVYKLLTEAGVPQRTIAHLTGQSQSEVSEILKGRRVVGYELLVRICTGLDIPRGYMGLAYDEGIGPAPGEDVGEVSEDMKRRALLATASIALLGTPVLGEVLHIPTPPSVPTPLPSRLGSSDIAAIRNLTGELRTVARTWGGCAETVSAVAQRSLPLMSIPGSDATKSALGSALADLHTLAGWCCVDAAHHDNARAHFATAMSLAVHDPAQLASALRHAGVHMIDAQAWNDGLKAYQLGLIKLAESHNDPEAVAWLHGESAWPLAAMGHREEALTAISTAREFELSDPFDRADMDGLTSSVYLQLGALDRAEAFAASAVRLWADEGSSHRDSVEPAISLAALHAQAGEPDTVSLAGHAITSVTSLRSVRARMKLRRLAAALETRPRSDFAELAQRARQVASVRI